MKKAAAILMILAVFGLLVACGGDSDNNATSDVHETKADTIMTLDVPTSVEIPTPDIPKTDVPKADTPLADVPTADTPLVDVPKADVPKTDTPTTTNGCDDYFTCMDENCTDAADTNELITCMAEYCDASAGAGVPDAAMGLIACYEGPCVDGLTYSCIFANCAADYFFCYHGDANETCKDTMACLDSCPEDDDTCGPTCIDTSSVAAGTDLGTYWTCEGTECPSEEGTTASEAKPCVYDADGYYIDSAKCAACLREADSGTCKTANDECADAVPPFGSTTCATTVTCYIDAVDDTAADTCLDAASKAAYEVFLRLYNCVYDKAMAGDICATECGESGTEEGCNTCFYDALGTPPSGCVGC